MAVGDLANLALVKQWSKVGENNSVSDPLIARLITAASHFIFSSLDRGPFVVTTRTITLNGNGLNRFILPDWPVLSVSSVTVDGQVIAARPAGQSFAGGFAFDEWTGDDTSSPQFLFLQGSLFYKGVQNVTISYTFGFGITGEAHQVPGASEFTVQTDRQWAADGGVTYANGVALTLVSAQPSTGQYSIDPTSNLYLFAAGDAGASVLISYSYTPADLSDACVQLVTERLKKQGRIGEVTHAISGTTTVSFTQRDMDPLIRQVLDQYTSKVPV